MRSILQESLLHLVGVSEALSHLVESYLQFGYLPAIGIRLSGLKAAVADLIGKLLQLLQRRTDPAGCVPCHQDGSDAAGQQDAGQNQVGEQ